MEDLLKVGVITTTHGVRGEVKVFPTTDDAERFLDIEYVLLDTGKELRRLNIQNVKFFKNLAILKFEGIDNINDIEMYKGRELWIPREEAQELGEDEYYVADLIGLAVSDADTGEDKMVKGAKREHKTVMEIAQYYTDAFFACGWRGNPASCDP